MTTLTTLQAIPSTDPNSPAWRDPALIKWAPQRLRVRDVLEGTDAVQAKTVTYLPQLPREGDKNYLIRLRGAEVVNLLAGAIRSAEGLITANPPVLLDEASEDLKAWWADVDGQQTGGAVWARGVLRRMMGDGWLVVLASSAVRAGSTTTNADVQALNLRPTVAIYDADHVMSVRMTKEGSKTVLAQLVLYETVRDVEGKFGQTVIEQYRVLQRLAKGRHTSTVYRIDEKGQPVQSGAVEMIETDELPVVEFSSNPTSGFGQAPPPLLDLGDLTLAHYRTLSDRRWALKQACFPWLVRIGFQEETGSTTLGPSEALDLPLGGDAKWIAPPPEAMEPTERELDAIERRAAALAMSFQSGEADGAKSTATAVRIDQQGQDASLAAVAVSFRDSMNRLGAVIAELFGEEPQDAYFSVQTSFRGLVRDPVYLRILLDAWKEGGLPLDAMLYAIRSGDLPDEFDVEAEAAKLVAEAEAAAEVEAERLRQQSVADPEPVV